jgi:PAS domain S-box-containing protein
MGIHRRPPERTLGGGGICDIRTVMRRWIFLYRDLGFQLLALYLVLIVPFLIALLVFNQLVGVRIRQTVQANDLSLASAIAQETGTSLSNSLKAVEELSTYPEVIQADRDGMRKLFDVVLNTHPDVNLVYRLDSRGVMVYHYPEGPASTVGTDFSFREYYQRALLSDQPLISEGRISPTTNQAVATAVMPIWSKEGQFLGLVGTNIRLESLSKTLAAITSEHQSEEGLQVAILDGSYQIIAYPDPGLLLHPAGDLLPPAYAQIPGRDINSQIARAPDDEERLYTYAPISDIHWAVIVSRPTSAAFATQIVLERVTEIAAATFVLIGLFFWGTLSIRVINPIERLAPISEAIGMNKPISTEERSRLSRLAGRRDQIGHLIQSILRMEGSIADRMREQATLLETSTAVVSSLDLQVVLDRILEHMGRLLKVERCAIIALDEQRGVFRVRASRGLSKRYTEQLSIQPSEPDSVTMRALHAREAIYVSDTETDPSYVNRRAVSRSEGYRAILAVPLNTQHAPPTALLVFHTTPHEFTHNEIQLLSSFGNQATMAIENAILFERSDMRLEEQTRRLEALIQSMEDGLILSDLKDTVVYANRRIGELASLAPEDLAGAPVDRVLGRMILQAKDAGRAQKDIQDILARRARRSEIVLDLTGRTICLRLEAFDVTDARATSIGHGLILQDVTLDRELDRMKSSLISTVSHELRTPLAAIKGYASTLLAEDVEWDRASQREFLSVISDETDRLSTLVNNLLDLSRIEAGSLRLSLEECHLEEMIQRAAKGSRLQTGNRFEVRIAAGLPPVYGDPPRLETVLRNLIENAVKYAGPEATIRVEVAHEQDHFVFRVSDDGPGIPPEESERIFESFYRVDNSLARIASGAGLGLAICQGLVRAHGGRIWVEPQEVGACIAFLIPLGRKRLHVKHAEPLQGQPGS